MCTQILLSLGYALSGVFPLIALFRRVHRNHLANEIAEQKVYERGSAAGQYRDKQDAAGKDIRSATRDERRELAWEVGLVGVGGVTLAAVTSIAAVWLL